MKTAIKHQLLTLCFVLPAWLSGHAQEHSFTSLGQVLPEVDHIGTNEGLPFREVLDVAQDSSGLMWFSLRNGIVRYDGYSFVPMKRLVKAGQEPGSLTGQLLWWKKDSLLICGDGALYCFNPRSRSLSRLPALDQAPGEQEKVVQATLHEQDNSLWLTVRRGNRLYLLRTTGKLPGERIDSLELSAQDFNPQVAFTSFGEVWWNHSSLKLRRYNRHRRFQEQLERLPGKKGGWYPGRIFIDHRDRVCLFGAGRGIAVRNPAGKHFQVAPGELPAENIFTDAFEDHRQNLWLTALDSIQLAVKYTSKGGRLLRWSRDGDWADLTSLLKDQADFSLINRIFEDRSQQLWAATDNGLFLLSNRRKPFANLGSDPRPQWGRAMRSLFEDDQGRVYVRCEGCGHHGPASLLRIDADGASAEPFSLVEASSGRPANFRYSRVFQRDPRTGYVWTLNDTSLLRIDLDSRSVATDGRVASFIAGAPNYVSRPLILTGSGRLVMGGTLGRLIFYNPLSGAIEKVLSTPAAEARQVGIKFLYETSDNSLWAGTTDHGLFRIDPIKGAVTERFSTETRPAISSNQILTLREDPEGRLWAGTLGGGLHRIDLPTGEVRRYTTADGLCNDFVTGILPWGRDYLWISTYDGLSCFDKKRGSFINYHTEDGLSHNEFNYTSYFIDSRGRYYFGGMNGLNVFYPADVLKAGAPGPPSLTRLTRYDERRDTLLETFTGIDNSAGIFIQPWETWFRLDFTLTAYSSSRRHQYMTRLEGLEKDWVEQGAVHFVRYTRLPAGRYTLRIRGSDGAGNWSEEEIALPVVVRAYWYQKNWMPAALLLGTLIPFSLIFYLLLRRQQQKIQQLSLLLRQQPPGEAINGAHPGSSADSFLDNVHQAVTKHLGDSSFGPSELAREIGVSRTQLYRKISEQTDQSVSNYIRSIRLQYAAKRLQSSTESISDIAYATGFNSPQYFTRCFVKEFGVSPSQWRQKQ